jgi:UDP-N-acetylglucosamine--N-acetylmuramyl-(pentapeptide) pyrophosphoryl-undecaprenol N-acetylglucosamine transferase
MKLAISAAGTGGHLFPGIAVAEAWIARREDNDVIFLGRRDGLEGRIIPKKGYRFFSIEAQSLTGRAALGRVSSAISILAGTVRAISILRRERPSALLSFGAYASVPPSMAAYLLKIPLFLHEQNVEPGSAIRFLARFASAIFVSFDETRRFFPGKAVYVTGNPLRRSIMSERGAKRNDLFHIFVLGGSRGASSINTAIVDALPLFKREGGFFFSHQTGHEEYEKMLLSYRAASIPSDVFPFKEEIGRYYAQADLVISRAGAMAICEISYFKRPCILIPYPYAARRHQWINAKYVERIGGCVVIEPEQARGQRIFEAVMALKSDRDALREMGQRMGTICRPDADSAIVEAILDRLWGS